MLGQSSSARAGRRLLALWYDRDVTFEAARTIARNTSA